MVEEEETEGGERVGEGGGGGGEEEKEAEGDMELIDITNLLSFQKRIYRQVVNLLSIPSTTLF
jgi:hypothetical protein